MPIPLPNLDDRTYADLVAEAQTIIPTVFPEWTNHNPSDPGIVLLEMLAWLTEMTLFQANEISSNHTTAFLELLNGPDWRLVGDMDTAVRNTILTLRTRYRAVTVADFDYLLFNIWPHTEVALGSEGEISRILCLPQTNLAADDPTAIAPAHLSLVILAKPQADDLPGQTTDPSPQLLEDLAAFLEPRLLLTTIHHVVKPDFVPVTLQARIYVREDVPLESAVDVVDGPEVGLVAFFDPHTGGPDGSGWPFGRGVYASEVYAILSRLPAVDYVDDVQVIGPDGQPSDVGVWLQPHQLVQIDLSGLTLIDIYGNETKVG
ncbi:MAG: hypothetical protein GY942_25080 [Aestuariibacter sp.]|nr:hypothetical protein [Aestuariibacter sp.]